MVSVLLDDGFLVRVEPQNEQVRNRVCLPISNSICGPVPRLFKLNGVVG